jgi:hypothetical protein
MAFLICRTLSPANIMDRAQTASIVALRSVPRLHAAGHPVALGMLIRRANTKVRWQRPPYEVAEDLAVQEVVYNKHDCPGVSEPLHSSPTAALWILLGASGRRVTERNTKWQTD